jgi:hypothetical protein
MEMLRGRAYGKPSALEGKISSIFVADFALCLRSIPTCRNWSPTTSPRVTAGTMNALVSLDGASVSARARTMARFATGALGAVAGNETNFLFAGGDELPEVVSMKLLLCGYTAMEKNVGESYTTPKKIPSMKEKSLFSGRRHKQMMVSNGAKKAGALFASGNSSTIAPPKRSSSAHKVQTK